MTFSDDCKKISKQFREADAKRKDLKLLNKRDPFDGHIIDLVKSGDLKIGVAIIKPGVKP
ncbi:MAG: hypothetical protein IMZ52_10170 [Actinobacteria bacterium]|nr:hypothetical protein [Actinomycetota bacterium]MBE3122568.1 hypothetical protein [Thermoplasmata archaeon]